MSDQHYLKAELYKLIAEDPQVFEFLQSAVLDGLWYWDIEHPEHEWMNPRFWELLGYDPADKQHLASEWQDLIDPDDLQVALKNFEAHCADPNHPYDQLVRYRHASGRTIWVRCRGLAIRDASGKPVRMLGAHIDVTELKEMEQELKELAARDALTGIHNRRSLDEHLDWIIKNARRQAEALSLAIIDADHFKAINDSLGHDAGDRVLKAIASTLVESSRANDFVARYGGEEFVAVLPDSDQAHSIAAAERLREAVEAITGFEIPITVSIGVATIEGHAFAKGDLATWLTMLLSKADQALLVAKRRGRNRTVHAAIAFSEASNDRN